MINTSFYQEDIKQEAELAVLIAKKKYRSLSVELESKIRANARKDFLAKMIYGGAISIPILRGDDPQNIVDLKKSAQNPLSVDDEEVFFNLTGGENPLDAAISEEMASTLKNRAPTFWGLCIGEIAISEIHTQKRRNILYGEIWVVLLELHPGMTYDEADVKAHEIAKMTWRDR